MKRLSSRSLLILNNLTPIIRIERRILIFRLDTDNLLITKQIEPSNIIRTATGTGVWC